jgi:hypothetical protein
MSRDPHSCRCREAGAVLLYLTRGPACRRRAPAGSRALAARRAAVEVSAQTGDRRVDVFPRELELDVAVELLEARLAADVRLGGTE